MALAPYTPDADDDTKPADGVSGGYAAREIRAVKTKLNNKSATLVILSDDLDDEIAARIAADSTLTTNLAAEVTARTNADTALAADIAAETSARIADVNAEETARIAAVSAEASTRAAADTTLQANITAEATARAAEDTTLATAILTESSTRASQVASLTLQVAALQPKKCFVYLTADISQAAVTPPTAEYITWDDVAGDSGVWDSDFPKVLTVPAGYTKAKLTAQMACEANLTTGGNTIQFAIGKNEVFDYYLGKPSGGYTGLTVNATEGYQIIQLQSPLISVAEGDEFRLQVVNTSLSTTIIHSGSTSDIGSWFAIELYQ